MSSHFQLHRERLSDLRNWIGRARFCRAIAFGIVIGLTLGASVTAVGAPQNAQPAANQPSQTAAPKPRASAKEEATPPSPKGMSYHTTTDRTAVWVGDQFHYLITVDYSSDYEFVLDNLNKENVNMDPFPVIDVQKTVTPYGNNQNRLWWI